MIACLAVIGSNNEPLYMRSFFDCKGTYADLYPSPHSP
jgi:hypothetical protein